MGITVAPVKGKNYPTWKIMVLMREGLWQIVTGEETAPVDGGESELIKFRTERLQLLF